MAPPKVRGWKGTQVYKTTFAEWDSTSLIRNVDFPVTLRKGESAVIIIFFSGRNRGPDWLNGCLGSQERDTSPFLPLQKHAIHKTSLYMFMATKYTTSSSRESMLYSEKVLTQNWVARVQVETWLVCIPKEGSSFTLRLSLLRCERIIRAS